MNNLPPLPPPFTVPTRTERSLPPTCIWLNGLKVRRRRRGIYCVSTRFFTWFDYLHEISVFKSQSPLIANVLSYLCIDDIIVIRMVRRPYKYVASNLNDAFYGYYYYFSSSRNSVLLQFDRCILFLLPVKFIVAVSRMSRSFVFFVLFIYILYTLNI